MHKQAGGTFRKHITKPSEQVADPEVYCSDVWPKGSESPAHKARSKKTKIPDEVCVVVVSVNLVEGDLAVDDEGARRVPPVGVQL